jgi:hypothetical protein
MNLYDEVIKKLEAVNAVQIQRGGDIEYICYNADAYRWESRRNGIVSVLQNYQVAQLITAIPHESRRKGSMLVVTQINPAIRAE